MGDKKDESITEQMQVRIPATLTLKDVIGIVTFVVSIMMIYGSITTRLGLIESNQEKTNELVKEMATDLKETANKDSSKIEKLEDRIRQLEVESAKRTR